MAQKIGCKPKQVMFKGQCFTLQGKMNVILASVGNPDFRQDPDRPLYGADDNKIVSVKNYKEAVNKCRDFITKNGLGGGNWAGGDILNEHGERIATISYNCSLWEPKPWPHAKRLDPNTGKVMNDD